MGVACRLVATILSTICIVGTNRQVMVSNLARSATQQVKVSNLGILVNNSLLALKKAGFCLVLVVDLDLSTFSTDASSKLHVLGHDRNSLSVDGAQVGIFEEADQVALGRFLQGHDRSALESEIGFEVLSDFTNKSLERQLADQELS